jgi:hypothetical protein
MPAHPVKIKIKPKLCLKQINNNPKIPKNQYNRGKTIYYLLYNVPQIPYIKFNHRLAVASSRQFSAYEVGLFHD